MSHSYRTRSAVKKQLEKQQRESLTPSPLPSAKKKMTFEVDSDTIITPENNTSKDTPKYIPVRPHEATYSGEVDGKREELTFFARPHALSVAVLIIIGLVYAGFNTDSLPFSVTSRMGIAAMIVGFLAFSMVYLKDGPFVRPHPVIWRVAQGLSIVYLLALTFLFFQSRDDARQLVKYLDPTLGEPIEMRSYGEACDLYTPGHPDGNFAHLTSAVYDVFFMVHLVGWICKALILRDYMMAWMLSILFEFLEMSFEHMLENFKECWWDHIILDVLLCNGVGIYIGMQICKYFEMKTYDWGGLFWRQRSLRSKLTRSVKQLTPFEWHRYEWRVFSSPSRFLCCLGIIAMVSIIDLNAFWLKDLLWIPANNNLNLFRLLLWFSVALPAVREYYDLATDPKVKKLGAQGWICICMFSIEVLISLKFGQGQFPRPHPPVVVYSWLAVFGSVVVFFVHRFVIQRVQTRRLRRVSSAPKLD